jgi:hypothetical protein
MMAKVVRLHKAKDNPGNPLPSPDFVLLSSLPDDHLLSVASDLGLALVSGAGSSVEFLSLVRAKELAQAALAQAQVKFAEQKSADDAAVVAAQASDAGPSVVQRPDAIAMENPPQVTVPSEPSVPKLPRAKSSKKPKQVCIQNLRKTPARQARVSLKVSK